MEVWIPSAPSFQEDSCGIENGYTSQASIHDPELIVWVQSKRIHISELPGPFASSANRPDVFAVRSKQTKFHGLGIEHPESAHVVDFQVLDPAEHFGTFPKDSPQPERFPEYQTLTRFPSPDFRILDPDCSVGERIESGSRKGGSPVCASTLKSEECKKQQV
jgi:hypothetical protein